MVIVDTSAWVEFLRRPASAVGREVARLLRASEVVMVGTVLAEVLQGTRGQQFAELEDQLSSLPYAEATQATWIKAAELSALLRSRGQATPLSDLVVAVQALEGDHAIFAIDTHFERVPELPLHEVKP